MTHQIFAIPNFRGTAVDLVLCNPTDPNSNGVVHYAYTVGAEYDAIAKRTPPWAKIQDFAGEYGKKHPKTIARLKAKNGYRPGEEVLDSENGPTFATDQDTIMRLGALELLANLSSGRLSTTDKDPFPHQLALQQFVRKPPRHEGLRRILIADEVGLGKINRGWTNTPRHSAVTRTTGGLPLPLPNLGRIGRGCRRQAA